MASRDCDEWKKIDDSSDCGEWDQIADGGDCLDFDNWRCWILDTGRWSDACYWRDLSLWNDGVPDYVGVAA